MLLPGVTRPRAPPACPPRAQSLIKDHGLGGGANGRVLLAGCSPGTIVHIDSIKTLITGMGLHAENTQVYGLFDSVLWVDVDPMPGSGVPPLTVRTRARARRARVPRLTRIAARSRVRSK